VNELAIWLVNQLSIWLVNELAIWLVNELAIWLVNELAIWFVLGISFFSFFVLMAQLLPPEHRATQFSCGAHSPRRARAQSALDLP